MYFEEKGPLVLSATLHLVALLALAFTAMAAVDENIDEDPPFDLYGDEIFAEASEASSAEMPFDEIEPYESEEVEPVTEEDIQVDETIQLEAIVELPPEPDPVVEEPVIETPPEPKPEKISFNAFVDDVGPIQETNKPKERKPTPQQDIKVQTLDTSTFSKLPSAKVSVQGGTSKSMEAYYNSIVESGRSKIEPHPMDNLSVEISLDFSTWGTYSNIKVVRSSGDNAYDNKVLEAYRRVGRYPVKSPNGKGDTIIFTITQA